MWLVMCKTQLPSSFDAAQIEMFVKMAISNTYVEHGVDSSRPHVQAKDILVAAYYWLNDNVVRESWCIQLYLFQAS
jgi:hypothetical protein